jgi:hypothetical protein
MELFSKRPPEGEPSPPRIFDRPQLANIFPYVQLEFIRALDALGEDGEVIRETALRSPFLPTRVRVACVQSSKKNASVFARAICADESQSPLAQLAAIRRLDAGDRKLAEQLTLSILKRVGFGGTKASMSFARATAWLCLDILEEVEALPFSEIRTVIDNLTKSNGQPDGTGSELLRRANALIGLACEKADDRILRKQIESQFATSTQWPRDSAYGLFWIDQVLSMLDEARKSPRDKILHERIAESLVRWVRATRGPGLVELTDTFAGSLPLEERLIAAYKETDPAAGIELMTRAIDTLPQRMRRVAVTALRKYGSDRRARLLLVKLLSDEDGIVRYAAYANLRTLTGKDVPIDWNYGPKSDRDNAIREYESSVR